MQLLHKGIIETAGTGIARNKKDVDLFTLPKEDREFDGVFEHEK